PSATGRSPATTWSAATLTSPAYRQSLTPTWNPNPVCSPMAPTRRRDHEVGYPCPPQDRPHRLSLADPALHRSRGRDPLRARRPGACRRRIRGGTLLRRPGGGLHAPGRQVQLRGAHRGLRSAGRPRPGAIATPTYGSPVITT